MSLKVKWPERFPMHWQLVPAKWLFPESKKRAAEEDEQLSATQDYGVISQSKFMELAGRRVVQLNHNQHLRKRVEIDDFVISMRSFQGGLERAWAAGGIRSSYVILKPKPTLSLGYYQHLFKSSVYIQALQSTANFIRDGQDMSYQDFILIDLPLPPNEEQQVIAAFLDYETARIDRLIAQQQRLIELLKEKRQAVISHAVTKGLNPNALMKDSGIEWLGQVPEHWIVRRLKHHIISMDQGWSPQCEARLAEEDEFGVMKVGCVNGGVFRFSEHKALPAELEPKTEYRLKKGQLLVSRANTRELVGSAAVVDADYDQLLLCDKLYRIKLSSDTIPEFVALLLGTSAYRGQIELSASGASDSMQNIGQSTIKELPIAVPPMDEANDILKYVAARLCTFDCLNNQLQQQNLLLQERRTALISAAVTGKIDLRGWTPPADEVAA